MSWMTVGGWLRVADRKLCCRLDETDDDWSVDSKLGLVKSCRWSSGTEADSVVAGDDGNDLEGGYDSDKDE